MVPHLHQRQPGQMHPVRLRSLEQGPVGRRPRFPYYEACQHMVRADYDGSRWAHTKNGTPIDFWDHIGVQHPDTLADPAFAFEPGWSPEGAACVAKTRWPDL